MAYASSALIGGSDMPLIRYKVTLDGQERDVLQEIATQFVAV